MKLKLVDDKELTPKKIAEEIKSDLWKDTQKLEHSDFVIKLGWKEEEEQYKYTPNLENIIQVRDESFKDSFVEVIVNLVKNTKDKSGLKKGTVVYFPEDAVINEKTIKAGSYKLIGGTHGTLAKSTLGITSSEFNIVNFKLHLNSNVLLLKRLGNLLNQSNNPEQSIGKNDIRNELFELMNWRVEKELDPTPTDEEKEDFVNTYPQISKRTIGQWISHHHEHGGRVSTLVKYTKTELDNHRINTSELPAYADYEVIQPYYMGHWEERAISEMVKRTTISGKKKVLITLYADNDKQELELNDSKRVFKDKVEKRYAEYCNQLGYEKIEVTYLQSK